MGRVREKNVTTISNFKLKTPWNILILIQLYIHLHLYFKIAYASLFLSKSASTFYVNMYMLEYMYT